MGVLYKLYRPISHLGSLTCIISTVKLVTEISLVNMPKTVLQKSMDTIIMV